MSTKAVEKRYMSAGAKFGDAVSYIYMGECEGFESTLKTWGNWEQEYAFRGYRTVSLDDFIEFGGYGRSIDHLLGQKREENESAIFHAKIYSDNYLGKVEPTIELEKFLVDENPQLGTYTLPSTKNLNK